MLITLLQGSLTLISQLGKLSRRERKEEVFPTSAGHSALGQKNSCSQIAKIGFSASLDIVKCSHIPLLSINLNAIYSTALNIMGRITDTLTSIANHPSPVALTMPNQSLYE